MTTAFHSEWVDFDTYIYWIGEVVVVRYKRVAVIVDTWLRDLTFSTLPGASSEDIATAMERVRQVLPRPNAVPTRRLPRITNPPSL